MNARPLAVPFALLCAAAPLAQDDEVGAVDDVLHVRWQDGRSANVEVLGIEDEIARLRVHVMGGSMVVTSPLADFTPESAFVIELAAADPQSFDANFALAKKAADLGLIPQAGARARAAIEAAKDAPDAATKEGEVRAWAADVLEQQLETAVTEGNLADARRFLQLLTTRLSDQRSEDRLAELAAAVDALEARAREERQAARRARLDAQARSAIERRLTPIYEKISAGDQLLRDAYTKARTTGASARAATGAIAAYEDAWKAAQALLDQYPDDASLQSEVAAMGERLHEHTVRAALQAANVLTIQGDYRGALEWTNRILALDPGNAEAQEMLRTIQIASAASSADWAWAWRLPRR
jgi:hypothetical protein